MLKRVAICVAGLSFSARRRSAAAADLDAFRASAGDHRGDRAATAAHFARRQPLPSPCHVIAEPQFNLSQEDVVQDAAAGGLRVAWALFRQL